MRAIDGDALIKALVRKEPFSDCARVVIAECMEEVRHAPTIEPERKWETCFDCPLSNGCPKIRGCTNEQAEGYASGIPDDCPLSIEPETEEEAYERGYTAGQMAGLRKTGKWNFIGNQMFECSECGTCYTQSQFYQMRVRISDTEFPKFCPNCGADMRGEGE